MTISILVGFWFLVFFLIRRSPKQGVQAPLPVSCPGAGKSRGLGVCCSNSPPHFHILYQHLHTWVVTTQALPVCAESAIQKACQRGGISTPPHKREAERLIWKRKRGECGSRGKLVCVWVPGDVVVGLCALQGRTVYPGPCSSGPGSREHSRPVLQRESRPEA